MTSQHFKLEYVRKIAEKNFHPFLGEGIDIFSPTKGRIGTIVPSPDVYENSA